MILYKLKQTCVACPSQWMAYTTDGRLVYIRYRSGWLTVHVGEMEMTNTLDVAGVDPILKIKLGDNLDGGIEWDRISTLIHAIYPY